MLALQSLSAAQSGSLSEGKVLLTPLARLAVLQATGADTVEFLQGQLTQDVKTLSANDARLTGYCTAKGRLLASGVIWKALVTDAGDPVGQMLVDAEVAPAFQKRLSMFVLRAKVKLAPTALKVVGVTAEETAIAPLENALGKLPRAAWIRTELPSGTWIAAPQGDAAARWWWVATEAQFDAAAASLADLAVTADAQDWAAADIAAGLPWITAATQDVFVPQTVNLELVGGVSFTKGCYPGQEVVARSHYLGKLKKRMFRGMSGGSGLDAAALPGADVFHSGDPAQPCGRVVNAAAAGAQIALLFESTFRSMEDGSLHLGTADGPAIDVLALPYPVAEKGE